MKKIICKNELSLFNEKPIPHISFRIFEDIEWLKCGFSTRLGGVSKGCFSSMNMNFNRDDDPKDVEENIRLFSEAMGFSPEDIVMPHQCHTANVQIVGRNECGRGVTRPGTEEEVDGQITNEAGVVLFCFGADCVPVFLVDAEKRVVSACHAGWKGTVGDITGAAIEKMVKIFGSNVQNIKAAIGPSICRDCYEVSKDVADRFIKTYDIRKSLNDKNITDIAETQNDQRNFCIVRPVSGDFTNNPTEKYYLNLWEANRVNLIRSGVKSENIEISGYCTKCNPDLFFSHRVHGNARGVNTGYIFICK